MKLEKIPFSKSDLSTKYPIILALRNEKGFETVDSLLTARENAPVPRSMSMERYANGGNPTELDPDPIFYKYISGLSEQQIDSIRDVKQKVLREYHIRETETERFRNYSELKQKFDSLIFNTSLPAIDEIGLLILVIVLVSTLVFILVVTKSVASLLAIALAITIASTTGYLMNYSFEISGAEYIFGSVVTLLFFIIAYFLIYKRKKTTKIFLFHCINAATISLILTILGTFSSTIGTISAMVVAILITEFFFIRKMYHKMSFG